MFHISSIFLRAPIQINKSLTQTLSHTCWALDRFYLLSQQFLLSLIFLSVHRHSLNWTNELISSKTLIRCLHTWKTTIINLNPNQAVCPKKSSWICFSSFFFALRPNVGMSKTTWFTAKPKNDYQRLKYIGTNQNNGRNENDHSFIQCPPYGVTWYRINVYFEMIFRFHICYMFIDSPIHKIGLVPSYNWWETCHFD